MPITAAHGSLSDLSNHYIEQELQSELAYLVFDGFVGFRLKVQDELLDD